MWWGGDRGLRELCSLTPVCQPSPFQGYTIAPLIAAPAVTADDLVLLIRTDALLRAFALSGLYNRAADIRQYAKRIPGTFVCVSSYRTS